jgi:hypothetical protein
MELLVSDISDDSNGTCKSLDSLHTQFSIKARAWLVRNREGLSPKNIDDFMQRYDAANTQRRELVIAALNERSQLSAAKIDTMIQQLVKAFDAHLEAAAGKTKAHFKWIKQQYRAQVELTRQANKLELRETLQLDRVLLSESVRNVTMQGAIDVQKQAESYTATMAAMRKSEVSMQQSVEVANLLKQKAESELHSVTATANERIEQLTQQINELQQALTAATTADDNNYRGRDSSVDSYDSVHSDQSYSDTSSSSSDEHEHDDIHADHNSGSIASTRDSLVRKSPRQRHHTRSSHSPKHKKSSSRKQSESTSSTASAAHRTKRKSKQPSTGYTHALAKTLPTPRGALLTDDIESSDNDNDVLMHHINSSDQHHSAQHRKRKRNMRPASAAAATTTARTSLIAAQEQQKQHASKRTSTAVRHKRQTYSADRMRAVTDSSLTERHEQASATIVQQHSGQRPVSFTSGYTSKASKHKAKSVSSVKRRALLSLDTTVASAVKSHVLTPKSKRHTAAPTTGSGDASAHQQYSLKGAVSNTDSTQQQQHQQSDSADIVTSPQQQQLQQLESSSVVNKLDVLNSSATETVTQTNMLTVTSSNTAAVNNPHKAQRIVTPVAAETTQSVPIPSLVTAAPTEQAASNSSSNSSNHSDIVHSGKHDKDVVSSVTATTDGVTSTNNSLLLGPVPTDIRYLQHLHSVQAATADTGSSKTAASKKQQQKQHSTKASVSSSKATSTGKKGGIATSGSVSTAATTATPTVTAAATDATISNDDSIHGNADVSIEEALAAALRNAITSGVIDPSTDTSSTNAADNSASTTKLVKQRSLRWLDHNDEGTQYNDSVKDSIADVMTDGSSSSGIAVTEPLAMAATVADADVKGKSI